MADDAWLVVGLGNPGPAYAGNRHNAGFLVLDLLAERVGGRFKAHKGRADVVEGRLAGQRVVLAKPKSLHERVRRAGGLRQRASSRCPVERLVVVHDELDVDYGVLRLKRGGGDGGHNGLKSITRSLGTKEYLRVRFGIGRPPGRQDPADFVLKDFGTVERKELPFHVDRAADAVEALLTGTARGGAEHLPRHRCVSREGPLAPAAAATTCRACPLRPRLSLCVNPCRPRSAARVAPGEVHDDERPQTSVPQQIGRRRLLRASPPARWCRAVPVVQVMRLRRPSPTACPLAVRHVHAQGHGAPLTRVLFTRSRARAGARGDERGDLALAAGDSDAAAASALRPLGPRGDVGKASRAGKVTAPARRGSATIQERARHARGMPDVPRACCWACPCRLLVDGRPASRPSRSSPGARSTQQPHHHGGGRRSSGAERAARSSTPEPAS